MSKIRLENARMRVELESNKKELESLILLDEVPNSVSEFKVHLNNPPLAILN